MKKITTYLSFLVLMFFLVFLYSFTTGRNGRKTVQNAVVEFYEGDNNFLTHSMVNKLLIQNNEFVKNQPKRLVNLKIVEANVKANSYVEKAAVFLTIDGVLKTVIKQRKPIARIVNNDATYYVDNYGVKIPLSTNFSARVPLVSGVDSLVEIKELIQLIKVINTDGFLAKEIIAIQKNIQNEYVFTVRSGAYKIVFGSFLNVDEKFRKLLGFYNKSLADNTIKNYKTINVKYHNQVVCTKQNQNGKP